ncbi:MAG: hypothetical protein NTY73_03610 [Candidatus Micrarchaeota archaeon]|nr:hypothetical protein [Candidatus Micrarchaeota archaeon]
MNKDSLKNVLEKQPAGTMERYKSEKSLLDKFGQDGIKVYLSIDGKMTAEEIMKKTGLGEEKFMEILNYLESIAVLKTELPAIKPGGEIEKTEKPPLEPIKKPAAISPIPLIKTEETPVFDKSSALEALVTKAKPSGVTELPVRVPKTPLEKKLYDKFGQAGLHAYNMIDEFRTPREILNETNISEEQLKSIIEFMRSEGIIRLERPEEAMDEPLKVPAPQTQANPAEQKPQPPKLVEKPAPKPIERAIPNKNAVCIPIAVPIRLINKLRLEANLLKKYGNEGVKAFSMMNGKKTNARIVKDTKIKPARLDEITTFLLQNDAVKLQCLTDDNIKEIYGEEGFSIYSKYGRDGILLYELIDKKTTPGDIVRISGIEPNVAVEMFAFVHKVLGLEIPLDTELLRKQLGIKK